MSRGRPRAPPRPPNPRPPSTGRPASGYTRRFAALGRNLPPHGVVVAKGHYRKRHLIAPADRRDALVQLVEGASPALRAFAPDDSRGTLSLSHV